METIQDIIGVKLAGRDAVAGKNEEDSGFETGISGRENDNKAGIQDDQLIAALVIEREKTRPACESRGGRGADLSRQ